MLQLIPIALTIVITFSLFNVTTVFVVLTALTDHADLDALTQGYDVITLTDCVATTDEDGQKVTGGSYGMFSKPMDAAAFTKSLE